MPGSFISASGRILTHRRLPSFHIRRLIIVSLLICVCILTNPSNKELISNVYVFSSSLTNTAPPIDRTMKNKISTWNNRLWKNIMHHISYIDDRKCTNYILFSLRRRLSEIELVIFSKNISICTFNGRNSNLCKSFGTIYVLCL